jgi:hypothetical protein
MPDMQTYLMVAISARLRRRGVSHETGPEDRQAGDS